MNLLKSTYKYQQPEGRKLIVSESDWRKLFGTKRGRKYLCHTEAYITENATKFHHVISPLGKLVLTLLSPLLYVYLVLCGGIASANVDLIKLFFQKRYGSFCSDGITKRSKHWGRWQEYLKKKGIEE